MGDSVKINAATLDAPRHITIRMSAGVRPDRMNPTTVHVRGLGGVSDVPVQAVYPFSHAGELCGLYSVELPEKLNYVGRGYRVEVDGVGESDVSAGLVLEGLHPPRDVPMGAGYSPASTLFRVFAPTAGSVRVVVADGPEGDAGVNRHDMTRDDNGVWFADVGGDLAGKYYAYCLDGPGFDPNREITDIYATCTQARRQRSLIVDLRTLDPPGFREHPFVWTGSLTDAIIYEMHIRDFTIHPASGVEHKGLYLGAAEGGTRLAGDTLLATGLDHLVEMGVTHVQLMPVHDADNDELFDGPYDWGYMPAFFNSPDGWYATDRYGSAKITELKTLIGALHARGIGVVLDVVYNHASIASTFDPLAPGYYFRHQADGLYSNGSGCGNEFYSERWMARRFIVDSVTYWATEYLIDGFRFDLMGLIDLETLRYVRRALDKVRPGILLYGEPWAAGPTPLSPVTDKRHVSGTGVAAFNDSFRDAIKGSTDGDDSGFVQRGWRCEGVILGLRGGIDTWSSAPTDSVNYFEAHDNLTAWDKLVKSMPKATEADRRRMMKLGALLLFCSQGGVFIHAGQEFCRTKGGNHNSYNLPDEINQLDWTRKKAYADVVAYFRGLIALRKAHPALRLSTRDDVYKRVTFDDSAPDGCIHCNIEAAGLTDETASRIILLANGTAEPVCFTLTEGKWSVHADANRASLEPIGKAAETIEVAANAGAILMTPGPA